MTKDLGEPHINPDDLRRVMRRLPTGICVITTHSDDGPWGMTANSFVSVSLDPLIVSMTVENDGRMQRALGSSQGFTVSILSSTQVAIAKAFADTSKGSDRFHGVEVAEDTYGPRIAGACGYLSCVLRERLVVGDHELILANVIVCELGASEVPAIYFSRGYYEVGPRIVEGDTS